MKHPRITPLIGRISGLAPVIVALTLGWSSQSAKADAVTDIDDVLQTIYAPEEGVTVTTPAIYKDVKTPNTVTAAATDLVYAVYRLASAQNSPYAVDANALSNLVNGALTGVENQMEVDGSPKYVRADMNVIAPRVLNAALQGAGFTGANGVAVVENLVNLNSNFTLSNGKPNTRVQLTVAGKQAVLAQGLKSLGVNSTNDSALGQFASNTFAALAPANATQATKDLYVQLYTGGLLKLVGTATAPVAAFTEGVLTNTVTGTDHTAYALKIAENAATNPAAAGAVIAGRALDLGQGATTDDYTKLLRSAFNDTKLAAARISSFAGVAQVAGGDQTSLGAALFDPNKAATTFGAALAKTTANKAAVVSGVIQGLSASQTPTSTQIKNIVDTIGQQVGTQLKTTEFATFAATAAIGSGDSAGLLANVLAKEQFSTYTTAPTQTVDIANRVAIAAATLKAIATASPNSGEQVAVQVIASANGANSTPSDFVTDPQLTTFAKNVATAIKATNGALIGSTVEGVASQLTGKLSTQLADFVSAVVPFAPVGALNITQNITTKLISSGGSVQFTTDLASRIPVAYSANAIAGIAAADPANAGPIANAAGLSTALKSTMLTLATSIATAVPEDRVVYVAEAVANLLKPLSSTNYNNPSNDPNNAYDKVADPKVPKISSIGILATNIGKVIQTKPLMPTFDRTIELSELAATLVDVAVTKIQPDTTGATQAARDTNTFKAMEPTLAAIGTAIINSLSPKLLQNDATLAADRQDALQQIAGAVAQAIAATGNLSDAVKHALLDQVADPKHPGAFLPGVLESSLLKLAGTVAFQSLVTTAFSDVRNALNSPNNPSHIVTGSYAPGANGKYASGNVFEPETPVTNLL